MKVNNFFWMGFTLATMVSCSPENELMGALRNPTTDPDNLTIVVTDAGGDTTTRATYAGLTTTFDDNDAIGVYAVDASGNVQVSNARFVKSGKAWTSLTNVMFNPDWSYYAYYPYVTSAYTPNFLTSGIDNQFATFITDASNKFHKTDQSSKANFTSSDLMIAQGSPEGIKKVIFAMNHKKGLVILSRADDFNTAPYSPYQLDDKKYVLIKPSQNVAIGSETFSVSSGHHQAYTCPVDPSLLYTVFTAVEDGSFSFSKAGLSYSLDGGNTWTALAAGASTPTVTAGNTVLWKNNTTLTPASGVGIGTFSATGKFDVSGNVMGLLYGFDSYEQTSLSGKSYAFYSLFKDNTNIRNARNLKLPASTLASSCYACMFYGCTGLISAPTLPATTLPVASYSSMFYGCTSLTTAPELPATTIDNQCYIQMFAGCTSLVNAPPTLPASTLSVECYRQMFQGCTSLTTAPTLAATTLNTYCCQYMFDGCTSLTSAPALPITTLSGYCYQYMFQGCTSLTSAPALPATTLEFYCYSNMFNGCTSLTTAPELPATTMKSCCYAGMFQGCTSLISPPALPATTLANNCYSGMFQGCSSLRSAPSLPATKLAESCYAYMFFGCSSPYFTTPPELPATTLATSCYNSMFRACSYLASAPNLPATTLTASCYTHMFHGCARIISAPSILPATTLTESCYAYMFYECGNIHNAPELPALTLVDNCYQEMFHGCVTLGYVKAAFTTTPSDTYTQNWLYWTSNGGTFVKNSEATWNVAGWNAIPSGWNVETYTP